MLNLNKFSFIISISICLFCSNSFGDIIEEVIVLGDWRQVSQNKEDASIVLLNSEDINNQIEYIYQERAYDTSSNELPSFSLVNYNFNYKIDNNFTSNFKISNILDQDYEVNRNYNTPGVSFFGGVESEF